MSVVITGVSQGGIGAACAVKFCRQGFRVFGRCKALRLAEALSTILEMLVEMFLVEVRPPRCTAVAVFQQLKGCAAYLVFVV